MCGICGFVNYFDRKLLEQMTTVLSHRGPDASGTYVSDKVSFGHRRLAIIDLSSVGKQPMFCEDLTVVMVANGEIYNYKELREKLSKKHKFLSKSDSEILVHGYEEWGIDGLAEKINGFFTFAIFDKKKETLFLIRDRIGVKPLYYYQDKEKLFFASEIKSILQNKSIKREINENSFSQYMAFQTSLGETTMFKNINKVPPASILTFTSGNINIKRYWFLDKDKNNNIYLSEEKCREFKKLLFHSVESRLLADVPIGVMLSGGLDSSGIVAMASKFIDTTKLKTFCIGFGGKEDEYKYARIVADKFHTQHQEINISYKNITNDLEKIVWHMDEPLADGGGIATYLASKEISKSVKVVLTGEGGDEAFGGYNWYKLGLPTLNIIPEKIKEKLYYYLLTYSRKNKFIDNSPFSCFKKLFEVSGLNFFNKMMKFEIQNILPNNLCMKVDKMTSAWGLEAREPFLDYKLLEFCYSLDMRDKISFFEDKILYKKLLGNMLPREILTRKKHGFMLPTINWLNGRLAKFSKEVILDSRSQARRRFGEKELEKLFLKNKLALEHERINILWRLLIFELWHRAYFVF